MIVSKQRFKDLKESKKHKEVKMGDKDEETLNKIGLVLNKWNEEDYSMSEKRIREINDIVVEGGK